jgi:hypothetical protein
MVDPIPVLSDNSAQSTAVYVGPPRSTTHRVETTKQRTQLWFLTAIIDVPADFLAAIHDGHPSATYVPQCV